ncbi:hypothetical protein ACYF6T_03145 [Streptomyces sp. 7R007]
MSAVAVGVVGAGNMGADHARTLHRWVSGAVTQPGLFDQAAV